MTNKERQKSLDKKKWLVSEKEGKDQSGNMPYCSYCGELECTFTDYDNATCVCTVTQEQRESESLCAKAYNRMYYEDRN